MCVDFVCCIVSVFVVKQKTAYEVRISDWSSDVCSSDLDVRVDRIDVSEDAEEPSARSYARRSIEVNLFSPSRSDGEASISLYLESDGTVKLYELASDWIWTLRTREHLRRARPRRQRPGADFRAIGLRGACAQRVDSVRVVSRCAALRRTGRWSQPRTA